MGSNDKVEVLGIVTIFLKSKNDSRLVLNNDKHALDIFLNLIFIEKLDNEGYVNTFGVG